MRKVDYKSSAVNHRLYDHAQSTANSINIISYPKCALSEKGIQRIVYFTAAASSYTCTVCLLLINPDHLTTHILPAQAAGPAGPRLLLSHLPPG